MIIATASYVEYRRRKRRAVLQRFQLRRLRRKYKLKHAQRGERIYIEVVLMFDNCPLRATRMRLSEVHELVSPGGRMRLESRKRHGERPSSRHSSSQRSRDKSSSGRRRHGEQRPRSGHRHGEQRPHSGSHRSNGRPRSGNSSREERELYRGGGNDGAGSRRRRRRRLSAEDEMRNQRRRDRQKYIDRQMAGRNTK